MFIAAFFIIANETHSPSTGEWINKIHSVEYDLGTSLAAQWLRPHASPAGGMDSIPDQETKIPVVKKKKKVKIIDFSQHT